MALLLLVCTLSFLVSWDFISFNATVMGGEFTLDRFGGPIGEAVLPYAILFPPLAFWHLCDLIEREGYSPPSLLSFSRYRRFVILLLFASPIAVFGAGASFDLTPCSSFAGEPGQFTFVHCNPPTPSAVLLVVLVAPVMALACISKAIAAIHSHLGARAEA